MIKWLKKLEQLKNIVSADDLARAQRIISELAWRARQENDGSAINAEVIWLEEKIKAIQEILQ